MPLIGHAVIGAATALLIAPEIKFSRNYSPHTLTQWIPFNIAIAYLPDITTELFFLVGLAGAKTVSHSFLFTGIAAFFSSFAFKNFLTASWLRSFFFFLAVIGFHDFLDMLQSADRQPFWPFSRIRLGCSMIPESSTWEVLIISLIVLAVVLLYFLMRNPVISFDGKPKNDNKPLPRSGLVIPSLILILIAIMTHQLRIIRERQLEQARNYIFSHQYKQGLALLEKARHWPAIIPPGRIEYLQAYVLAQSGQTDQAEALYLLSWKKNSHYFWTIADLIILYAQENLPVADKKKRIKPWYDLLNREFANHGDLPEYKNRLKMLLGKDAFQPAISR